MIDLKISNSEVVFRVDVNFENCEVDMVLKEMSARGVQTPVPSILTDGAKIPINETYLPYTPSEASVDFCLHWIAGYVDKADMYTCSSKRGGKTELENIGVEVKDWYGLMQGCCHLNCACDLDLFSNGLVKEANNIIESIFKKYCVCYETN
jgi:hypothetical protein